jgi:crotonobetainyl-CoA:carnitine CoA-transferase CaiB-like acyl-CoA transferase
MGIKREQQGNTGYYAAPSDVYETRDGGWIIVPTIGGPMFRRWARLVGREDLIEDERCKDDISRGDNYALINEAMTGWCAARTKEQAIAELEEARVPCGPVYDLDEVLADPQVRVRNLIEEVEFPGGTRPVPIAAPPARVAETLPGRARRAPMLGEHTNEILMEVGFSVDEIEAFRGAKAI